EALIQMPTDEFFNTGIYTYLWVFNKNKPEARKNKVMVINGSEQYEGLKKSRGTKRKQMNEDNRGMIVNALVKFKDSEIARIYDKWHFYYNKQAIRLTNLDEDGNSFEDQLPVKLNKDGEQIRAKSVKLVPSQIVQEGEQPIMIDEFQIWKPKVEHQSLKSYLDAVIKPRLAQLDYREENLKVVTEEATWQFDEDRETLIKASNSKQEAMGCGKILVKASLKKKTAKVAEYIQISCELTPDYEKDYEIISYSPDPLQNQQLIADFMEQYISRPFEYLDNVVGVEINFNKVFYQPEVLESVQALSKELNDLEKELRELEISLIL
ncbi:MAG: N-6 DNA methylase, partial [Bacteroidota bacterium]